MNLLDGNHKSVPIYANPATVLGFLEVLRSTGCLAVSLKQESLILRSLSHEIVRGELSLSKLRSILQNLLVRNSEELLEFDRHFRAFFSSAGDQKYPDHTDRKRRNLVSPLSIMLAIFILLIIPSGLVPNDAAKIASTPETMLLEGRTTPADSTPKAPANWVPPQSEQTIEDSEPEYNEDAFAHVYLTALNYYGAPTVQQFAQTAAEISNSEWNASAFATRFSEQIGISPDSAMPLLDDAFLFISAVLIYSEIVTPEQRIDIGSLYNEAETRIENRPPEIDLLFTVSSEWTGPGRTDLSNKRLNRSLTKWLESSAFDSSRWPTSSISILDDDNYRNRIIDVWKSTGQKYGASRTDTPRQMALHVVLLLFLLSLLATFILFVFLRNRPELLLTQSDARTIGSLFNISSPLGKLLMDVRTLSKNAFVTVRRPHRRTHTEIDAPKTLNELVNTGKFIPYYASRNHAPHYLYLVDHESTNDPIAGSVKSLAASLRREGVAVDLFYYQRDAAVCFPETTNKSAIYAEPPILLEDLHARFHDSRLVLFSSGEGIFESESWAPRQVCSSLTRWSTRVLLTTKPINQWGKLEHLFAEQLGFVVGRATREGLDASLSLALEHLNEDGARLVAEGDLHPTTLTPPLSRLASFWMYDDPPDLGDREKVRAALINHLGIDGYFWLCATSVFPVLNWEIVGFLGSVLKDSSGNTLFTERRFAAMCTLPFFRAGKLPEWLRLQLITDLGPRTSEVRAAFVRLVDQGTILANLDDNLRLTFERRDDVRAVGSTDPIFGKFLLQRSAGFRFILPDELRNTLPSKPEINWRDLRVPLISSLTTVVACLITFLVIDRTWARDSAVSGLTYNTALALASLTLAVGLTFIGLLLRLKNQGTSITHGLSGFLVAMGIALTGFVPIIFLAGGFQTSGILIGALSLASAWGGRSISRVIIPAPRAGRYERYFAWLLTALFVWLALAALSNPYRRLASAEVADASFTTELLVAAIAAIGLGLSVATLRQNARRLKLWSLFQRNGWLAHLPAPIMALMGVIWIGSNDLQIHQLSSPVAAISSTTENDESLIIADESGAVREISKTNGLVQSNWQLPAKEYATSLIAPGDTGEIVAATLNGRTFSLDKKANSISLLMAEDRQKYNLRIAGVSSDSWIMSWMDESGQTWAQSYSGTIASRDAVSLNGRVANIVGATDECWIAGSSEGEIQTIDIEGTVRGWKPRGSSSRDAIRYLIPAGKDSRRYYSIDIGGAVSAFNVEACEVAELSANQFYLADMALVRRYWAKEIVVAIDAGHGGQDPGALGVLGAREADIVLLAAQELASELEKVGISAFLTRSGDFYVEHEDRLTMSRNANADLFISLHADAARVPTISGASVYTISTRGEARMESAARQYGWDLPVEDGTSEEVSGILQGLTVRETKSNSSIFAEFLVAELGQAGPLLRQTPQQRNLFVLLSPDVPAVLVELGFLTNADDERRLRDDVKRRQQVVAISNAVQLYFDDRVQREQSRFVIGSEGDIPSSPVVPSIRLWDQSSNLLMPATGRMTRVWGDLMPGGGNSKGISIVTPPGQQVVAPIEGTIEFSGPFRSYGQMVIISTSDGFHIILAGMGESYVSVGQSVTQGEVIAQMSRGSNMPELYLETRLEGRAFDPMSLNEGELNFDNNSNDLPEGLLPPTGEGTNPFSIAAVSLPAVEAQYFVPAGAFRDIVNAQRAANEIGRDAAVRIEEVTVDGLEYFRVLVGPFSTEADAAKARLTLDQEGHEVGEIIRPLSTDEESDQAGIEFRYPDNDGGDVYVRGDDITLTPEEEYEPSRGIQSGAEELGVASVYGDGFNGQPTGNGEIFDDTALTGAHPSLPLPSLVQVINEDNGREVIVRINDRGPFDGIGVIELSRRAGAVLGIRRNETANVRIRYLGPAPVNPSTDRE